MTVCELKDIFDNFVVNEFNHLRNKVDWIFYIVIATALAAIVNLAIKLWGK